MDLGRIPTEELQGELNRRASQARCQERERRRHIGEVLAEACNEIQDFKKLLVPNTKGELYQAIFGNSEDYEIKLTAYHNPLDGSNY